MAKKKSQPKRRRKEEHPTVFVFDGSIRCYEEGSMLELHTQISPEEWEQVVDQTVAYKVFVECLKEYACPQLDEKWSADDDWFRIQLDVAVSRMRNIDALLVAKFDQKAIKDNYLSIMKSSVSNIKELMSDFKSQIDSEKVKRVTDL